MNFESSDDSEGTGIREKNPGSNAIHSPPSQQLPSVSIPLEPSFKHDGENEFPVLSSNSFYEGPDLEEEEETEENLERGAKMQADQRMMDEGEINGQDWNGSDQGTRNLRMEKRGTSLNSHQQHRKEKEDESYQPSSFLGQLRERLFIPRMRFGIRMNQLRGIKKDDETSMKEKGSNIEVLMKMNEGERIRMLSDNFNRNVIREEAEISMNKNGRKEGEKKVGGSTQASGGKHHHHFHRRSNEIQEEEDDHQVKHTPIFLPEEREENIVQRAEEENWDEVMEGKEGEDGENEEVVFNHGLTDGIEGWTKSTMVTTHSNQPERSNIMRNEEREWERVIGKGEPNEERRDSITTSFSSSPILSSPLNHNDDSTQEKKKHSLTHIHTLGNDSNTLARLKRKKINSTSNYSFNDQGMNGHVRDGINHPNGTMDDYSEQRGTNGNLSRNDGEKKSSLLAALKPEPISPDIVKSIYEQNIESLNKKDTHLEITSQLLGPHIRSNNDELDIN